MERLTCVLNTVKYKIFYTMARTYILDKISRGRKFWASKTWYHLIILFSKFGRSVADFMSSSLEK